MIGSLDGINKFIYVKNLYYCGINMSKEVKELDFKINEVKEKEPRTYKKGSKYDKMLDAFVSGKHKLSELVVPAFDDASYLRLQISKRIQKRNLDIKASVANGKVYLEKVTPEKA